MSRFTLSKSCRKSPYRKRKEGISDIAITQKKVDLVDAENRRLSIKNDYLLKENIKFKTIISDICARLDVINKYGLATKPKYVKVDRVNEFYYDYYPPKHASIDTTCKIDRIFTLIYNYEFVKEYRIHKHYIVYNGKECGYCVSDEFIRLQKDDMCRFIAMEMYENMFGDRDE